VVQHKLAVLLQTFSKFLDVFIGVEGFLSSFLHSKSVVFSIGVNNIEISRR